MNPFNTFTLTRIAEEACFLKGSTLLNTRLELGDAEELAAGKRRGENGNDTNKAKIAQGGRFL